MSGERKRQIRQRPRSRRHVAMKDDRRLGDERRDRGRAGREVTGPRRSPSPPRRRPHQSDRLPDSEPRDQITEKVQPQNRTHQKHRERSRERLQRPPQSPPRRDQSQRDQKDRFRAPNFRDSRHDTRRTSPDRHLGRSRSRSRTRGDPLKSPSSKRQRSRSLSQSSFQRKKSKRDASPRSEAKSRRQTLGTANNPIDSSRTQDRRSASPIQREPRSKQKARKRPRSRRGRSRSLDRKRAGSRNDFTPHPQSRDESRYRKRSRSPPAFRGDSPGHQPSPSSRGRRPPTSPRGSLVVRRSPAPEHQRSSQPHPVQRSDSRGSLKRSKYGDESRFSRRVEPVSGANSIEVNMAGRGNYRGGFSQHQQMQNAFPHKTTYNNDPRQYSQSPQHVTPNSSYHGSPNHSPYPAGRGGWGGQQYSPQHQFPPQYPQGNYGPPSGPQSHYHANASFSPPHSAPTGPMQQYPSGNHRGNYRGGGGSFRGNHFNSGRGNYRGNSFKSAQWNSSQSVGPRGQPSQVDDASSYQQDIFAGENEEAEREDSSILDQNPFRPSKGLQMEDSDTPGKDGESEMPPPSRPAPTGPGSQSTASSKFSFAFKATSKSVATTPKPEISQKFNAAPQRKDPVQNDARNREPPSSAPTEPASARARQEQRQSNAPTPRTRKVKKKMRRLKPRPSLPADLVSSDSVFFRKPGNESVVGSGTYGKVFKALHVYTKELVALKRIRMEGERDGFPVTAVREIKLLQSLKHTNIVQLQEVMVEKNDCFMVFEYLSHDLTGLLNHPTFKLDPGQKKHLAKQLFEGLDYLHNRGVLHRDIKAANILVSSDGILKLADFGLARFYAKRHQLDYTNRVITIWYRSPELLLGETQYGPACDVWSAACVMVEIFSRHAIFPGDGGEINQLDKIYAVLGTPNKAEWPGLVDMPWFELLRPSYRRPSSFAERFKERVTPAAFTLLASMFRYDPSKRPSAAEVLESPYFKVEEPPPRQAVELRDLDGDWHEFESKALRRENERRDREARRGAGKDAKPRDKERKRESENPDPRGDTKRMHVEGKQPAQERDAAASAGRPSEP